MSSPADTAERCAANVLVTDGEQRAALAVVRSLGRAGHGVHVASASGRSLAGASRYAVADHRVPDPLADPDGFFAAVRALVEAQHIDTVMPVTEAALVAILPRRDELGDVLVPFPDAGTFARVSDKHAVLEAAGRLGIAVPEQTVVCDANGALGIVAERLRYPIVVKPARSVAGSDGDRRKLSVAHAGSAGAFREILSGIPAQAYPLLLQQRIVGPGVGVFVLLWDGELVAACGHRRLREKPPAGGVSVYRESVPVEPVLLDRSVALLGSFGWRGVAMVEYKIDAGTGTPYLMEINGRFWGSLQLAIDSGVDFPLLLLRAARGEHVAPVTSYRTGVRSRWWWGDVDQLVTRLRRPASELSLPPGTAGRAAALREFLRRDPRDRDEIAQRGDLGPFWRESRDWIRTTLGRGGGS